MSFIDSTQTKNRIMMKRFFSISIVFFYFSTLSFAQMWNGIDTLFGNEWIDYDQQYFKMLVAEDGIYRVDKQTLEDAGVPLNSVTGAQLRVYHLGEEVPIFTSNSGSFATQDYVEFYGNKNRSELDYHIFGNPVEDMMNPRYSLFTDTSAYFLTWNEQNSDSRLVETVNNLTNLPPKETSYLEEMEVVLNSHYSKEYGSQTIRNSYFETAEGFGSQYKVSQTHLVTPSNASPNGNGNLHIRYATDYGGASNTGGGVHDQRISINGVEVASDESNRFNVLAHDFPIVNGELLSDIEVNFAGQIGTHDKQSVAFLELKYPRLFNFDNESYKYFKIAASNTVKYLEIENFNTNGVLQLFDLTNQIKLLPIEENGVLKIALPPSSQERALVLLNETEIQPITSIEKIVFSNFLGTESNYTIISHKDLMIPDANGLNQVQEYANYRASTDGGNYNTTIVDIENLYDQFSYGVVNHPIAIRNFGHFLQKNEELPEYFLLIGNESHQYIESFIVH